MNKQEKQLVQWSAESYSDNSMHHREYDRDFLEGLDLSAAASVLDIGCGSGEFTSELGASFPQAHFIGIDASQDMIDFACRRRTVSNVDYLHAQAQNFVRAVAPWAPFDVVLSRATLHWVPAGDQPRVLANIHSVLRPGGAIRLDMGASGQLPEVMRILNEESLVAGGTSDPWFFPDVAMYAALLEAHGFSAEGGWVRTIVQPRRMPDFLSLKGWLESQIFIAFEVGMSRELAQSFRDAVLQLTRAELRREDGSYDQEYVRLDVFAHRISQGSATDGTNSLRECDCDISRSNKPGGQL